MAAVWKRSVIAGHDHPLRLPVRDDLGNLSPRTRLSLLFLPATAQQRENKDKGDRRYPGEP